MLKKINPHLKPPSLSECTLCRKTQPQEAFPPTPSFFYPSGRLPLCYTCIESYLSSNDYSWQSFDKLCQYADVAFSPSELERAILLTPKSVFSTYLNFLAGTPYEVLEWSDLHREFRRLQADGIIDQALPLLSEKRQRELRDRWGHNYDDEELTYLERLYTGLTSSQNISGDLQADQAQKLCKLSLEIDSQIRSGNPVDKLLGAYERLVKIGDFTPQNTKSAQDFDSVGELYRWLEKRGWVNTIHDGTPIDIVDRTINNIIENNTRLYTNESDIGEEITRRIEALHSLKDLDSFYDETFTPDPDLPLVPGEEEGFSVELTPPTESSPPPFKNLL